MVEPAVVRFLCVCLAVGGWGLGVGLSTSAGDEKAPSSAANEAYEKPAYALRPIWKAGTRYRWLQRLDAVVTVAGLGKQKIEWRQNFHVQEIGGQVAIGIERIRVDLEIAGDRSRYYFDPTIALRFQERTGVQGMLLRQTELFVRNRYKLVEEKEGGHRLVVEPIPGQLPNEADGEEGPEIEGARWEQLPWETLTAALLHQGIPEAPLKEGDEWQHTEALTIPPFGKAEWKLECLFSGFKQHEERSLALVKFSGVFDGAFHQDATLDESPGVAITLPSVRGLTLIDLKERQIVSTVVKLEGELKSLGLPGAAEDETAPIKKTLTLSLVGVD